MIPAKLADAGRILKAIREYFPHPEVTPISGLVVQSVPNKLLPNVDEDVEMDRAFLELLMVIDELSLAHPDYAAYIGCTLVKKQIAN